MYTRFHLAISYFNFILCFPHNMYYTRFHFLSIALKLQEEQTIKVLPFMLLIRGIALLWLYIFPQFDKVVDCK